MGNGALSSGQIRSDLMYQALEQAPVAVYVKDAEQRILWANQTCWQLLGQSPDEHHPHTEAELFSAAIAQHLTQLDVDAWDGSKQLITPTVLGVQQSTCASRKVIRRVQLTTDGQALICYLEPLTPSRASHASEADSANPWQTPELETLLSNVPAVIFQLSRPVTGNLQFLFVSTGAHEIFGISSSAILANAQQILQLIHPLDRPQFDDSLMASATAQTAWRWEGRYYRPDGKVGWIQTVARPQILLDGQVVWDGLMMDITSRKHAEAATLEQAVMEQALADNESRFRMVTETIPGALMQLRVLPQGYAIDFVSDHIKALTGLVPIALTTDAQTFTDRIHPLDCQRFQDTLTDAGQTHTPWSFEGRLISLNGEIRWCRLEAKPIADTGDEPRFCGVLLDISDRKQVEEAYREQDSHLRMALKVSSMGVWTWDMATDQMAWTTEPGTLFEASAVSFCDTFDTYLQNVYAEDRHRLQGAVSQAIATGQEYQIQYRLQLGDSTIRWVEERGGVWRDPDGIVLGLMGTVVDITDRITIDEALRESEERNRTLINNIPGAVYRCKADQQWTLLFQSEAIADITGYPVDHPIHLEDWRLIHPDDRQRVDHEIAAAISRRRHFEVEYRLLHAEGGIRWVLETGQPIADATGTVQLIDGVLTDITRRKQSETRLRDLARRQGLINRISTQIRDSLEIGPLLETTVQAVRSQLNTDRVMVYRFYNETAGRIIVEDVEPTWQSSLDNPEIDAGALVFPDQRRVCGVHDVYQADLDPCLLASLEQLQVRAYLVVPIWLQRDLWGLLIAHECRGPRHWTTGEEELLVALSDQVGIAIGQAELYQQATDNAAHARQQAADLKATLLELQRTQSQLVQNEKMSSLGQLVAGVAHEINNPVSFIDGNVLHASEYAQDLLSLVEQYQKIYPDPPAALVDLIDRIDLGFLMEDFPKLLDSMRIGAERIKDIVASLRTFSRTDEAEIKAVDIHAGLNSTLMILQHRLKAHGDRPQILLQKKYSDLPLVECYAGKLNQVFMNLLSNAIDAIEEQLIDGKQTHPPVIEILTETLSADTVQITISDNGSGIPEAARQQIFEPFYTTKPIGKGTGIGLSISYQIIGELHHGNLICDSEHSQGTAFRIQIPVRQGTT